MQLRARLDVLEKRKQNLMRESNNLEATVEDLKRRCTVRQGLLVSSSRALNAAKAAKTATEEKLVGMRRCSSAARRATSVLCSFFLSPHPLTLLSPIPIKTQRTVCVLSSSRINVDSKSW